MGCFCFVLFCLNFVLQFLGILKLVFIKGYNREIFSWCFDLNSQVPTSSLKAFLCLNLEFLQSVGCSMSDKLLIAVYHTNNMIYLIRIHESKANVPRIFCSVPWMKDFLRTWQLNSTIEVKVYTPCMNVAFLKVWARNRTRGNGHKMECRRFPLNITKYVFIKRVTEHWHS